MKKILALLGIAATLYIATFIGLRNPTIGTKLKQRGAPNIETQRLQDHVEFLTSITPTRSAQNPEVLNQARDYIQSELESYGCSTQLQTYNIEQVGYSNIICSYGPVDAPRLIVGAHYDVHYEENPGADDNASGVAGLLELARVMHSEKPVLDHRIDLVAYTLEELPYFRTKNMGSTVHAQSLRSENANVIGMIAVEMIGYFSDAPHSQHYPVPGMRAFYPGEANFVAIIGNMSQRKFTRKIKTAFGKQETAVYSLNAPRRINGIDFSDHLSYWDAGYDAVMITDTSFMRNPNYHTNNDTIDTLDFTRMSHVVSGLYGILLDIR